MSELTAVRHDARPEHHRGQQVHSFAAASVLGIAASFTILELLVAGRYGFHRDELYFLACARHLSWGYVDQPPLVPAVAWLSVHAFGTSPVSIRILPALAGGGAVVLTGLMARELGGGRKAQLLAALAAATSPQVLAACHLLSTAAFDMFFWCAATFLVVRILRTGDEHLWIALGVVVGLGLLNKWNIGFLVVALAVGFVVGPRRAMLWGVWPVAAAGVALLLWLPDLLWNAQHQWAEIAMTRSLQHENGGLGSALAFIPSQIVVVGPVLIVFWIAGLRHLFTTVPWRPLAVAYLFLLAVFTVTAAKSYYLGGMYFVLFAAGGVWAEGRLDRGSSRRGVRGWVALMVVGGVMALPLSLPVLPASALPTGSWEGKVNKDLSATVGWRHMVDQIAGVDHALPSAQRAHLVVLTGDYGAAGAIDLWGKQDGLPDAISGHNNYWWWGPGGASDSSTTIAVDESKGFLLTMFSQVTSAGSVTTPGNVWTEERGDPIWICRGQKVPWGTMWPSVRHYG